MKLVASEETYVAECHTDSFGFTNDDRYIFRTKEELENFLGINDNHENRTYKYGTDIFGEQWKLKRNELPVNIYSKIEYEVDWEGSAKEY